MNNHPENLIRLLVIEDNATLVLAGLRNFFRPGRDQIQVAHVAENVEQVVIQLAESDFDVTILDLFIPHSTPTNNIQALKQKYPCTFAHHQTITTMIKRPAITRHR